MSDCVDELRENDDGIFKAACDTLLRVSSNILKSPKETKFRLLKVSWLVPYLDFLFCLRLLLFLLLLHDLSFLFVDIFSDFIL